MCVCVRTRDFLDDRFLAGVLRGSFAVVNADNVFRGYEFAKNVSTYDSNYASLDRISRPFSSSSSSSSPFSR